MASTAQPVKILSVGPAVGSIRDLFAKIRAIDAKHGKFDCVLCLGDFFGPLQDPTDVDANRSQITELLDGHIQAPLRCYIMQGENPLPESVIEKYAKTGGELCKDVFLLNKSAVVSTAHGLRIACLGGIYHSGIYDTFEGPPGFASPFYTTHTVERLLSNTLNNSTGKGADRSYGSLAAIRDAASSSQLIDIFITNDWPASISSHTTVPLPSPEFESSGSPPLDEIIRKIKPRYHFTGCTSSSPKFWEREPFVWDDEGGRVSRFISLGSFGGDQSTGKKQRWFYAFSIAPSATSMQRPGNITNNPFVDVYLHPQKRSRETAEAQNFIFGNVHQPGKRARTETQTTQTGKPPSGYQCKRCGFAGHYIDDCPERTKPPEGYVCRICNIPGHLLRDCPTRHAVGDTGGRKPREGYVCRACGSELHYIADCPVASQRGPQSEGGKRRPPKEIGPDECWFCLSNPNLAKHLIVSIGMECYLTLPKGQIIPTQAASDEGNVPGGGHVLIVPIAHQPTYNTIPIDIAPRILDETERYKSALRALFAKHGAVPVFYEVARLRAQGGHAHVQVVPIPNSLQGKVEDAFIQEGRAMGIDFEQDAEGALEASACGKRSYFRVDLPDGRKLIHLMKDSVPFSVQFGRQVLVSLLKIPTRLDWKACTLPEADEMTDVESFKKAFAPFDPSL